MCSNSRQINFDLNALDHSDAVVGVLCNSNKSVGSFKRVNDDIDVGLIEIWSYDILQSFKKMTFSMTAPLINPSIRLFLPKATFSYKNLSDNYFLYYRVMYKEGTYMDLSIKLLPLEDGSGLAPVSFGVDIGKCVDGNDQLFENLCTRDYGDTKDPKPVNTPICMVPGNSMGIYMCDHIGRAVEYNTEDNPFFGLNLTISNNQQYKGGKNNYHIYNSQTAHRINESMDGIEWIAMEAILSIIDRIKKVDIPADSISHTGEVTLNRYEMDELINRIYSHNNSGPAVILDVGIKLDDYLYADSHGFDMDEEIAKSVQEYIANNTGKLKLKNQRITIATMWHTI